VGRERGKQRAAGKTCAGNSLPHAIQINTALSRFVQQLQKKASKFSREILRWTMDVDVLF